jgi:uncharacterized protein YbaP (TraB family)
MLFRIFILLLSVFPLAVGAAGRHGALFRVAEGDRVAYLFGTVHVGRSSFYPLAPEVASALAASRTLVLELDTRQADGFGEALRLYGSYPTGQSIRSALDKRTLHQLEAALSRRGLVLDQVAHLKPWLIANLLVGLELHHEGFERPFGAEYFLLAQAEQCGQTVAELESAAAQLAMFDSMGAELAVRYLQESLDGLAANDARALMAAWIAADASALDALYQRLTSGDSANAEFTRRLLLGKRNPEMANGIEKILRTPGTSFVGVGVLHLLGAEGLPQLLAQRGYKVERVY